MGFLGIGGSGKKKPPTSADKLTAREDVLQDRAGKNAAQADQSRNQFDAILSGGQAALEESVSSAMSSAMPEFRQAMQNVQETQNARGVGIGGLGTSYEGDLESAFQRNIADAAGKQAASIHATDVSGASAKFGQDSENASGSESQYLDLLAGNRDYATAEANAKKKRKAGLFGALGSVGGAAIGTFLLPGIGTELGAKLGGGLGEAAGG
jgi:hypothetical protein